MTRGEHIVPKVPQMPSGIKWLMLERLATRSRGIRDSAIPLQKRIWELVLRLIKGTRR